MGASFQNILVGVDFSNATGMVVDRALKLARAYGAKVHLVHVIRTLDLPFDPGSGFDFITVGYYDEMEREARREMEVLVQRIQHVFDGDLHTEIRIGFPAVELLEAQKEHGADLIVLGAHKYNILERILVGGTTLRVVREAPCSVLIVRKEPPERKDSPPVYLVPLSLSESSLRALDVAVDLATRFDAKVVTLTVIPPIRDREELRKLKEATRARGRQVLERYPGVTHEVVVGHAAPEILRAIQEIHPEKVILGPRRKHSLVETILGTTTERIVRDSETSVLVVRG